MVDLLEIRKILKSQSLYLATRYGVSILGIFGSYVRGEQKDNSDLDILIELEETRHTDLLDLISVENYLSEILGIKVDIAIKSSLRKRIGQHILDELVSI